MGQSLTLEELKAENAAEETEEATAPQAEAEAEELEAVDTESEEAEQVAELDQEGAEETETEAWMQTDEPASEDNGKKFTDHDIAAAKKKYAAKLERKHNDETQALLDRIAALEGKQNANIAPAPMAKPRREDFYEADDPDEAYTDALLEFKLSKVQTKQAEASAANQFEVRQQKAQQELEESVNSHYQRAATLAQEANISPEVYQSSDKAVRQAIESAIPGQGDLVADQLISRIGEGSEKVMYFLGRNPSAQIKLQNALRDDPSGISAAIYVGSLKSDIAAPKKKTTNAPKPATNINGDATQTASADKMQKQYGKLKDVQARLDFKRKAKADGVDTSKW